MKLPTSRLSLFALALLSGATARAQAPAVTGTLPVRNATSAPRTKPVSISFSQPVPAAAAENIRVFGGGQRRTGTVQGGGSNTLRFQPATPFAPGENVSVTVPATVANPAQVYSFTAAAGVGTGAFGLPFTTNSDSHLPVAPSGHSS